MKQVLKSIPVEEIVPNPDQPRKRFDEEGMEALVESIRANGLIQPIVVTEGKGAYVIVAGERRWQAAVEAGLREVPAIVADTRREELLPRALIENLIREDLNPVEEAEAYKRLSEEGWSHDDISKIAGKTRSAVSNAIRLLDLAPEILDLLREGKISAGHAKALLMLTPDKRLEAAKAIVEKGLSVRAVERMIETRRKKTTTRRSKNPEIRFLEEKIRRAIGVKVDISGSYDSGKVIIEYYNRSDLDKIVGRLT